MHSTHFGKKWHWCPPAKHGASGSRQHEKIQPTGVDSLPPEEEGRPGLDGVAEDWAVVVRPGCPGHGRGGLLHLGHPTVPGRAGGTWKGEGG